MFEPKVALTWDDTNNIETGYKIYRSNSPMDIEDMPLELVVLDKDQSNYIDYDVIDGNQYYYRIGAFTPVDEEFSEEVVVTATGTSEHIIYTQSSDLVIYDKTYSEETFRSTLTSTFNTFNNIFVISDVLYFTNNTTLYKYEFPSMNFIDSKTFSTTIRGMDYDNSGMLYIVIVNAVYKINSSDLSINYMDSITTDEYGARAVAAMKDGVYWAHTNGIGGQSTIIRRKSDNVAVSTYAVTSSLVAKLSFIEELDYLYSSHTGNGRQVTRTTLSNFSRTTYQDGTNNPTYYSSEYYYDGNEYRILWQTADPTTFQNVNVSFSDIATISTSNLPYVSKDIATDDIYVTDQERIYKINKTTNQAEEYFYDPTAISSLQLVYITVA